MFYGIIHIVEIYWLIAVSQNRYQIFFKWQHQGAVCTRIKLIRTAYVIMYDVSLSCHFISYT